jgi:hypothetical protein
MPKRKRTAAEQRRDDYEAMIRRCLSLIALYQEMAESWLAGEHFDAELCKRMLAVRESVLALVEASMPLPLSAAELDQVATESRAIH